MCFSFYARQFASVFAVVFGFLYVFVLGGVSLGHFFFFGALAILGQWAASRVPGFGQRAEAFEVQCRENRLTVYLGALLGIIPVLGARVFAVDGGYLSAMPDWRLMLILVGGIGVITYGLISVRESEARERELIGWFASLNSPRIRWAGEWVKVFDTSGTGSNAVRWLHESQWRFLARRHGLTARRVRVN